MQLLAPTIQPISSNDRGDVFAELFLKFFAILTKVVVGDAHMM